MLKLTLNGEPVEMAQPCSLAQALTGRAQGQFAVAVDGVFVPRSQYDAYQLKGGEALEVLSPMQGG